MAEKGGKGFSLGKGSGKSASQKTPSFKDDANFKFSAKSGGKLETPVGGKGGKAANGGIAKGPVPKEPAKYELSIEKELPTTAQCLMDCEAANILQGVQEQMIILSRDPTVKLPVSFDRGIQYAKPGSRYTNPQRVRQVLQRLKKYGVSDGEICAIANIYPETVDEVFALVSSLKANRSKLAEPLKDIILSAVVEAKPVVSSSSRLHCPASGIVLSSSLNVNSSVMFPDVKLELKARSIDMGSSTLICHTEAWQDLKAHVEDINRTHLRHLMSDNERCKSMMVEFDGMMLDYSRQRATDETMDKLFKLAEVAHLKENITSMYNGDHINKTENRSVLHVALRAPRDSVIRCDGKNVVPDVWKVLDQIHDFSEKVRNSSWVGVTGKTLKDVISIGIGGSYLGPLFVHTALQTDPEAIECAGSRQLRFLANVDPVDVARNITGLNPETTLVVVVSKTFTTAETMLNARTLREWISTALGPAAVSKHMVAVSTNLTLVEKFGIDPNNAFAFWDWVGGRYSVCSAVGMLPLSLQYGFPVVEKFLRGASSIDQHFYSAPFQKNLPVLLGLLSVWNVSFLGYPTRAILPYSQALEKFAPHIQQVSMESNGKGVSIDGVPLPFEAGEVDFGEPGTNGQHSFYQLIHQGRVIPCDFIGVVKSQQPVWLKGELVTNHDELMSNFFAQPDALAYGKTPEELQKENVPQHLVPHKTFIGNRPSLSLLLPSLNAYNIGQLLAIYEHRIAVEGFTWGVNSFDQWGVELGKSLASQVRKQLHESHTKGEPVKGFNFSTTIMLNKYLEEFSDGKGELTTTMLPRM
ncbi:hypothetical protein Nepgr_007055 [Nepenthes gracilis]|uniref:Glucose-6-phosphate isomerase n=1 Tax=Nepenthes gracilis TaxID=150966 RepID=A0AAD3S690_NEPGR|nr:hypothetical protein Nepgr_007055 [Nepenthes gracilis]